MPPDAEICLWSTKLGKPHNGEHAPSTSRAPTDGAGASATADQLRLEVDGSSICALCAGERSRVYRPGAPEDRPEITSPEAAADILVPMLSGLDREHCVTLNLDTKNRLIATTTVSIGSIDHTFVSPREIFRDALLHGASSVVVAHNHPSGDAEPSRDDELVTKRVATAGDLLGVEVRGLLPTPARRPESLVPDLPARAR